MTTTELTTRLSYLALPRVELQRVRADGVDDFGHPVRVFVKDSAGGAPLRCCLRDAEVGERVALIAWRPLEHAPDSVYAEVGPVFVHADECGGYADDGTFPPGFRHRRFVLRSYAADGDMLETGTTDGAAGAEAIARLLERPDAVVVHARAVEAGCFVFAAARA